MHPRRLIRRLALLSLILFPLLIASLWTRSHFVEDDLQLLRVLHVEDGGDNTHLHDDNGDPLPYERLYYVHNQYFTLASYSGSLSLAFYRDDSSPEPRTVPIEYFWGWRRTYDDPADRPTDIPLSGGPLFHPNEWLNAEIKNRATYLPADLHFWNKLGFMYDNGWNYGGRMWSIRVTHCPWWFITFLSMLPLSLYSVRWLRRRRRLRRIGLCPTCSYDLRAHNTGDKCPECGTSKPPHNSLST